MHKSNPNEILVFDDFELNNLIFSIPTNSYRVYSDTNIDIIKTKTLEDREFNISISSDES